MLVASADSLPPAEEPSAQTQEKVAFIFNNLSQSNINTKAEELKELLDEGQSQTEASGPDPGAGTGSGWVAWLARYLVLKRATTETNFHQLYAQFLVALDQKPLNKAVLAETIRNIKVLLQSEKSNQTSSSDRVLLKHLGKWLGMVTLARGWPLRQKQLDLRSLLLEASQRGQAEVLFVVPFIAKVMESAARSPVFRPPNPWTMAIMAVLAELHSDPSLKLNLKFEVEVLCKNLELDVTELQNKSRYPLKMNETYRRIVPQLAPAPVPAKKLFPGDMGMGGGGVSDPGNMAEMQARAAAAMGGGQGQGVPQGGSMGLVNVAQSQAQQPKQPMFSYHEINTYSVATGLGPLIRDNYPHQLLQTNAHLRAVIKPTIEKTVQDLLGPVVDRSVKIVVTTCEQMIKKDFALDPDEVRMRPATQHMTRYLAANMTMITCKEPLLVTTTSNLRHAFNQQLRGGSAGAGATVPSGSREAVEQLSHTIALDNYELCVAFIQKTAIEKALLEIEKRLTTDYELRRHARNENRRYCDPKVLTYQAERMPEQLRLKVGTVTPKQMIVYDEFGREIPGFSSRSGPGAAHGQLEDPGQLSGAASAASASSASVSARHSVLLHSTPGSDEFGLVYSKMYGELEQHLKACQSLPSFAAQQSPLFNSMKTLCEHVRMARTSRDNIAASNLLQLTVESLLMGLLNTMQNENPEVLLRFRDCHLLVLKGLQDPRAYGPMWTNKNVTKVLMECREPIKFSVDGIDCLIKNRLVNMQHYDVHLMTTMENGFNYHVVAFAIKLVHKYLFDENSTNALLEAKYADLFSTTEMLLRIGHQSRSPPEELTRLMDMIRNCVDNSILDRTPGAPINMMHSGISQAREFDDPPGLKEKTELLLREWVTMYHSQSGGKDSTKAFSTFVTQMHTQGILKTDDLITRFFRICTEICVDVCYRALNDPSVPNNPSLTRARCYHTLDAFVRLIALLVRHSGDAANTLTKINLLNKVLGLLTGVMLQDHEMRNTDLQQLPYHRIFIMLLLELCAPDEVLDGINFQVLTAFSYTLHVLRPSKAPGFAYAWLELISNRIFIARMLHITPQQKAWAMYAQLLIDQFRFLAPFLRNAELSRPVQLLYKGTLRVLLVLLHDFPEFLCEHHYVFADVIPPNCIQMRNLILSAFPRHMRLPDPFTPDLKVDMLRDIVNPPRILTNFAANIPSALRKELDMYLKTRAPVTFLSELRSHLQVSNEPGMRYNVPLMNALVLYVGVQAIAVIQSVGKAPSMSTIPHSPHMDVYQNLAVDLDTEGRYLFLNAIANHLRYPNNHTHYFSCTLLYLFAEANSEHIQEQITRVLLERVIVNRPHPWGLLITFIELINNPNFKFWSHEFVRCAPEIEKLFDSVAKSCMQRKDNLPAALPSSTTGGANTATAAPPGTGPMPPGAGPTQNQPTTTAPRDHLSPASADQ